MKQKRVVIMGAAGRDFHNFNVVFRDDPHTRGGGLHGHADPGHRPADAIRRSWPGRYYPEGIPIVPEAELDDAHREEQRRRGRLRLQRRVPRVRDAPGVAGAGRRGRLRPARARTAPPCRATCRSSRCWRCAPARARARRRGSSPTCSSARACGRRSSATPCPTATWSLSGCSASPPSPTSTAIRPPWRSARSTSPTSARAWWSGRAWTTQAIVDEAEKEAPLIIWDGGNNDFSFLRSDLEIVIVDPFRPGHELAYHPGEVNLRRADVVVINKVSSAPPENVEQVEQNVAGCQPRSRRGDDADSVVTATDGRADQGQAGAGGGGRPHAHPRRDGDGRRAWRRRKQYGADGDDRPAAVRPGPAGRDLHELSRTWGPSCPRSATTASSCAISRRPSTPFRPTSW